MTGRIYAVGISMREAFEHLASRFGDERVGILSPHGRAALFLVAIGFLLLGPILAVVNPFWLHLTAEILIFALFAMALDLVFGYTGLPSFGHAAMFGTGGYVVAYLLLGGIQNLVVVLVIAMLLSAVIAWIIGVLSIRGKGVFFAFLTLAFAQVLYIAVFTDLPADILGVEQVTNGDDGLVGVPEYELFGFGLGGGLTYYFLTLVLVSLSVVLIVRIANSPFGRTLQGIRENEERMAALGYNVRRYKTVGFVISGIFTGLAGALFVPLQGVAHPEIYFWLVSGELVVIVLIGGMGTLWGPMLGATLFVVFEHLMRGIANWRLFLGLLFVLIVIFLPSGLAGGFKTLREDPSAAAENARMALRRYVESVKR